ncbi:MAG: hypothetical protein ACD_63C00039G0002 [uncultured bacterium]|nr:MAG: hypothetical protein ACD_63C00039G0002 [uncultured bacterium]
MGELGKKVGMGILQAVAAFFDKKTLPTWLRWSIITGVALIIFWKSGWDFWFLLKVIAWVLWILTALVTLFIVIEKVRGKRGLQK